jgi:hypothetical protein
MYLYPFLCLCGTSGTLLDPEIGSGGGRFTTTIRYHGCSLCVASIPSVLQKWDSSLPFRFVKFLVPESPVLAVLGVCTLYP